MGRKKLNKEAFSAFLPQEDNSSRIEEFYNSSKGEKVKVGFYITKESDQLLEKLWMHLRSKEGKHITKSSIIERSLKVLADKIGITGSS